MRWFWRRRPAPPPRQPSKVEAGTRAEYHPLLAEAGLFEPRFVEVSVMETGIEYVDIGAFGSDEVRRIPIPTPTGETTSELRWFWT